MTSIGKAEIPDVGTYLYAEAWAEGQIGGTGSNQRLPEYDGSDSEASVHMTGALARTGEQMTMDVTQGNDGNGHSTAAITLRNNSLQSQTSAVLVATLLDAAGTALETKKTSIGGAISGETFQTETVTFSQLGTRVVVRAAVPGNDLLTFEGLAVGLGDFTANGTNYTYTLQNDSGATSTLVTAVSGNGEPVSINGQALSTGGSATVAIPNSGTTDIVVEIGAKTYTLTILRNSGTGGGEHTHSYGSEWKYDATNHWHECSCGDKADKAAHTAGEWIIDTPTTATTSGSKHKECTICGYTMTTETIPATGGGEHTHSYGSEWKYDATNHWHECSCGDKDDVAAHSFKWVVDKEATATQKGSKHEECKVCGYKKAAVEIPATGSATKPTDPTQTNPNTGAESQKTGDNSNMILWIALLFISGGAVIGITVYSKKKKENAE